MLRMVASWDGPMGQNGCDEREQRQVNGPGDGGRCKIMWSKGKGSKREINPLSMERYLNEFLADN